jgi:hypothetical protein
VFKRRESSYGQPLIGAHFHRCCNIRDKRPINRTMPSRLAVRSYILFQLDFCSGGGASQPLRSWRVEVDCKAPFERRSSSSQCWPGRNSSLSAGPTTATRSSYATARSVNAIRLLATAVAASRRTTSITTGSGSVGAGARSARRHSRFFRCFLFLTRTSVCGHAARRCGAALRNTVHGRRQFPS